MKSLTLSYYPNTVLRTPCVSCTNDYEERLRIGNEMLEVMFSNDGYGLSANQVGLTEKIFVMKDPKEDTEGLIFCNPYIQVYSPEKETLDEGCLSIPGNRVKISRSKWVVLKYELPTTDLKPIVLSARFVGMDARCIQHEMDHLSGILVFDHIKSPLAKKLFLEKYAKRRRAGR